MAQILDVHPRDPQSRLINTAVDALKRGGVLIVPTDSSYAFIGQLDNKEVAARIRHLRGMDDKQFFTLLCPDLAGIAQVAKVSNQDYRLLKLATPGPWTFVLEASAEVPRRVSHPSRKTIGIRVPDHAVVAALLREHGEPVISITCIPRDNDTSLNDVDDIRQYFDKQVEVIIDSGACINRPTTMIDLSKGTPSVLRIGQADPSSIGIQS